MKMRPAHVAIIRASVAPFNTDFNRARYTAGGLSDRRFRWDILRAAGLIPWVCDVLYVYLDVMAPGTVRVCPYRKDLTQ